MSNNSRADNRRIDESTGTEFVGHEWDGIEELNTPLPRWWLWTFYATIVFAAVYVVLYPAWPMVEKATDGVLGWSSRGDLAEDMAAAQAERQAIFQRIAATDITKLADDPELMSQAISGGASAFKQHCVQCHGAGAAGNEQFGYPNLNDDDWLWGGDIQALEYTLTHGIRWDGSDATRISFMPAFGEIFDQSQIDALVAHVQSLSGNGPGSRAGAALFETNCSACHGSNGSGDRTLGAPALNDAIWLYGNSTANIRRQISAPRHGVMPGWSDKLDPVTIKMLAAYVHSRGGGEENPTDEAGVEPAPEAAADEAQVAVAEGAESDGQS